MLGYPVKTVDDVFIKRYEGHKYFRIFKEIYVQSKVELLFEYSPFMKQANEFFDDSFIVYNEKSDANSIENFIWDLIDYLQIYLALIEKELDEILLDIKDKEGFIGNCEIFFYNGFSDVPKKTRKYSIKINIAFIQNFLFSLFYSGRLVLESVKILEDRFIKRPRKYSKLFFGFVNDIYEENKYFKQSTDVYTVKNALIDAISESKKYRQFKKINYELKDIKNDSLEFYYLEKEFRKYRSEYGKQNTSVAQM